MIERRSTRAACLIVLALALVATTHLSAQTSADGAIRGYVEDEQRAIMPGVSITATSPTVGGKYTTVTDSAGYYRLIALPPGTYTLSAELLGFARTVREGIVVRAGLSLGANLVMKVGAITETVEVKADTPMLESSSAVSAVNVSGDLQRQLPLSSRRIWDTFLELTPGVQSTHGNLGSSYSLHGADFDSHVITIDGADVAAASQSSTLYVNLAMDVIADVQVKIGGIDASSPLGFGAVVNLATQSGTNAFRGAAGVTFQPKRWSDNNSRGGTAAATTIRQGDLSLGGPLKAERLWFFGAGRLVDNRTGISRTTDQVSLLRALEPRFEPFDNKNTARYLFLKLNGRLSSRHDVDGFFQSDFNPIGGNSFMDTGSFSESVFGGRAYNLRLTSRWNRAALSRLALSYNDKTARSRRSNDDPGRTVHRGTFLSAGRLQGTGGIANLNAPFSGADAADEKLTISGDVSFYLGGRAGPHELRAGLNLQPTLVNHTEIRYARDGFQLEELVLRDPANPGAGLIPFHRRIYDSESAVSRSIRSSDYAFYLQDTWRPFTRVTLNAGLRLDVIQRRDELFDAEVQDSRELGPRVGALVALDAAGRNTLRASWGRVHEVLANTLITAGSNSVGLRDEYDTNLDGSFETTLVTPGATALTPGRLFDPERHQPRVDELSLGYRRQWPGHLTTDVGFVRREYRDRTAYVEVNGLYEGGVFRGYRDERSNEILQVTNNRHNWYVYSGIDFAVTKQTSRLQWIGSYTRGFRHVAGTWQPNDPAAVLQPATFPNNRALGNVRGLASDWNSLSGSSMVAATNTWRDHIARLAVAWQAPWRLQLATSYSHQSGPFCGPVVMRLSAADPRYGPATLQLSNGRVVSNPLATTIRFAYSTRGEGQVELPAVRIWNLRVARESALFNGKLEAALDVFNVTNEGRDQSFIFSGANQLYSPNFGRGSGRQFPRSAEVSLRFAF